MSLFFLGSTLKKAEMNEIVGYSTHTLIKERADLIKEILIRRAFAPIAMIRKLSFYSLPMSQYEKYADKHSQVMLALQHNISINSIVAFTVDNQKDVFTKVNSTFPYGDMNDETRKKYIADLDKEFGDKLVNLYEDFTS